MTVNVFITDDHALVRDGMKELLRAHKEIIHVVGDASNGKEAVEAVLNLRPDVVLMDLEMPVMGGLEAIERIKKQWGEVKIIALTSYTEDDKIYTAIKAGAKGYLLKEVTPDELIRAILDVHAGKTIFSPSVAEKIAAGITRGRMSGESEAALKVDELTGREHEVFFLLAKGKTRKQIAEKLHIEPTTVRFHQGNILSKLGLSRKEDLMPFAIGSGIISPQQLSVRDLEEK
jgi:NarL family two-component system response regulator LiaR